MAKAGPAREAKGEEKGKANHPNGWLTNSRCIAEELSKVAHTGKLWSKHCTSDSGTELVTAVLKGLKLPPYGEAAMYMRIVATQRDETYEDRWDTEIYF